MDISKLPKLSQTPAPPAPPAAEIPASPTPVAAAPLPAAGNAAEAWISIAVGLLLLLVMPNTLGYVSSKLFHTHFAPFADPTQPAPAKCDFILFTDGTKIFYRDTVNFWSDVVITAFALVLIVDGVVMASARRSTTVLVAFCVTAIATLANAFYLIQTMSSGLPLISAFAVIFGVYIAISQWNQYHLRKTAEKARA